MRVISSAGLTNGRFEGSPYPGSENAHLIRIHAGATIATECVQ